MSDLREKAEKATRGPWTEASRDHDGDIIIHGGDGYNVAAVYQGTPSIKKRAWNAAYIAAVHPQAVIALLDERDALAARVELLEGALKEAVAQTDGLMADFDGCTDDANDASRLHEWDGVLHDRFWWMEPARQALGDHNDG